MIEINKLLEANDIVSNVGVAFVKIGGVRYYWLSIIDYFNTPKFRTLKSLYKFINENIDDIKYGYEQYWEQAQ